MANANRWEDWTLRAQKGIPERETAHLARQTGRRAVRGTARVFPSIIVSTNQDQLIVRAEVPGMKLRDFEINVSGDTLMIQGVRLTGEGRQGGWYHRRERESGGFSRAVRLPETVDGNRAEATYDAGVLKISLPLKETAKPQRIPVQMVEG